MLRKGGSGLMAMLLAACQAAEIEPNQADAQAVMRGRAAAARLGCGACHVLPDIDWPRGRVGPDLAAYGARALIAGRLPNRPETLASFVQNAPAHVPGTAMPAIPMHETEAQDIAAWLQSLR